MYFWVLFVYLCYSDHNRQFYADYAEAYVGEPLEDTVDYFEQQYAEETSVGNRLVDTVAENEYDGSLSLPLLRRERAVGEDAAAKKEASTAQTAAATSSTQETTSTKDTTTSTKETLTKEIPKMPENQCAQHGIFCRCGFQSVKFAYKYLGSQRDCYSLKGVCQYCGKKDRVTQLGFDYTYDTVDNHDVYRMRVLKENELWIPPEYNYKCMKGHVVTGVMSKYVRFPSLGDRDFYILKIKCTKLKGKTDPNLRPETWKGEGECGTPDKFSGQDTYFLKEAGVAVRNAEDGWGSSAFLLDQIGDETSRIGVQFTCSRNSQVAGLKYKFGAPTNNYDTIDFGLACRPNGKMEVWELGKSKFVDVDEYTPADTNEIRIMDGYVQYRVADRTIYTSKVKYSGKSHFQVSMHDEGSTVRDIAYICRTDKFDQKERRLLQNDEEENDEDEYELHLERLPELLGLPEGDVMFVDFPDQKKTEAEVGAVYANNLDSTLQNVLKQFEGFVGQSVTRKKEQQGAAVMQPDDEVEEDTADVNEGADLQEVGYDPERLRQSDQEELQGLAAINAALDAQLNEDSLTEEVEVGELEPAMQDLVNDLFPEKEEEDDIGVPFYDAYDEHEVGEDEKTAEDEYLEHVFDEIFTEVEVGDDEDANEEEENLGVPFYDANDENEVGDIAFIDPYVEKEVGTLEDDLDQKVFGSEDSDEQTESLKPLPVGDDFFKLDDSQIIQKFLAEEEAKASTLNKKDLLKDILSDKHEKKTSETHEAKTEQQKESKPRKEGRWHTLEDSETSTNLFNAEAEVGSINIKHKADEAVKESTHYLHKIHRYFTSYLSAGVHVWAKLLGFHGLTFTADYAASSKHKVWWAHLLKKGHHAWVSASIVWKLILLGSIILSMLTIGVVCFHCRKRGDKIDVDYLLPSGDEQDDLIIDHNEQAMLHY